LKKKKNNKPSRRQRKLVALASVLVARQRVRERGSSRLNSTPDRGSAGRRSLILGICPDLTRGCVCIYSVRDITLTLSMNMLDFGPRAPLAAAAMFVVLCLAPITSATPTRAIDALRAKLVDEATLLSMIVAPEACAVKDRVRDCPSLRLCLPGGVRSVAPPIRVAMHAIWTPPRTPRSPSIPFDAPSSFLRYHSAPALRSCRAAGREQFAARCS
jgi:hypothetical protein